MIRAAEVHRYDAVIVENVTEAADWELWDWWLRAWCLLGYNYQLVSVSSAHVGGEGNPYAPQWRDRLYIVFTRKGIPLPDVSPRPLAWCPSCEAQVIAMQAWKRTEAPRAGKYGQQYVYICPACATRAEPYILPAASILDWDDLGPTLAERAVPLVPNTIRRIEFGRQLATADADIAPPPFGELRAPGGRTITRGSPRRARAPCHPGQLRRALRRHRAVPQPVPADHDRPAAAYDRHPRLGRAADPRRDPPALPVPDAEGPRGPAGPAVPRQLRGHRQPL